ncbi:hypothetical protein KAR91_43645 [Candidatus Pacearchaeota archaeon]|nr:hypothetical protein [Candidatus Pacearchaeota archaeon]
MAQLNNRNCTKCGKPYKEIDLSRAIMDRNKMVCGDCFEAELESPDASQIRQFDSGATRDTAEGKLDYEGFLSPLVLKRYAEYLHKHRIQSDGKLRDSDNWQQGIPIKEYMKSKARHFFTTWLWHRNKSIELDIEESLCAEIFNTMGMLFELLKIKESFIEILKAGENKKFVCPARWEIKQWAVKFEDIDNNCGWYVEHVKQYKYLHKDLLVHSGTDWNNHKFGEAPGYWPTEEEAKAALVAYLEKERA